MDYNVGMSSPTSLRWSDPALADRVASFATQRGITISAAIQLLTDEALRMREHPGIVFRDGPGGRRAGLAGGPDVWEVVRSLRHATTTSGLEREELVATNTGLTLAEVRVAVGYYTAHPTEVDGKVAEAEATEEAALQAWQRRQRLLA